MLEIEITERTFKSMREIEAVLKALPSAFEDAIYSDMTFAAARRFTRKAKASPRFTDRTGKLRSSFRTVRIDTQSLTSGRVIKEGGARSIFGGKRAPHGHLIEQGTAERTQATTGRRTGRVVPRHMLGDAFESEQDAAGNAAIQSARRNFKRFVKAARNEGKLTKNQIKRFGRFT